MNILKRAIRKIYKMIINAYKFDQDGERVDITYTEHINFDILNIYEKSHFRRYEFASSKIGSSDVVGDLACGTGYGSLMLSQRCKKVTGVDINKKLINAIKKRYQKSTKVQFICSDLLNLQYEDFFDVIVSFETIEHFTEEDIVKLLTIFSKSIKSGGKLIISTPYCQEKDETAIKMGHHKTFYINEIIITNWFEQAGFQIEHLSYQNYDTHDIKDELDLKHFIICEAKKI